MKSDSSQIINVKDTHANLTINSEETPSEESLISKLLRWLVASVILGKLSRKLDVNAELSEKSSFKTLQNLLENVEKGCGESNRLGFDCEEVLALSIFYLQQLLGMNFTVLPSVVSSLSLLLLCKKSKFSGMVLQLFFAGILVLCFCFLSQSKCLQELCFCFGLSLGNDSFINFDDVC